MTWWSVATPPAATTTHCHCHDHALPPPTSTDHALSLVQFPLRRGHAHRFPLPASRIGRSTVRQQRREPATSTRRPFVAPIPNCPLDTRRPAGAWLRVAEALTCLMVSPCTTMPGFPSDNPQNSAYRRRNPDPECRCGRTRHDPSPLVTRPTFHRVAMGQAHT